MIRVFFLIFEPSEAWARIVAARRGVAFITALHLMPFLLLLGAVEGYSLVKQGKWQMKFDRLRVFDKPGDLQEVIVFEVAQLLLMLGAVFFAAHVIRVAGETFHQRSSFRQTFTLAAHAFSPVFLLKFLDVIPMMSPVYPWLLGMLLVMAVLYQGIPIVLLPPATGAFGLYISVCIIIALISGVVRLFTGAFVMGYLDIRSVLH